MKNISLYGKNTYRYLSKTEMQVLGHLEEDWKIGYLSFIGKPDFKRQFKSHSSLILQIDNYFCFVLFFNVKL